MRPLVTIVTPSLNQGRFLRATIESVVAQDYPHLEYIVMDGGSTDETLSIAKDYASRLCFISETDRGQSHAINKGWRAGKGDVLAWINSDDLLLPGAVSHAVAALNVNPHSAAIYGQGWLIDEAGERTGRFPATVPFDLWRLIHLSDYILQQSVYFRRGPIVEAGYLDESLRWTMDWDILIRIGKQRELTMIPEFLGCLREHLSAKTAVGGAARVREIRDLLRKHSGQRFPPGYIAYGLETYRRLWEAKLPASLASIVHRATGYIIDRAHRTEGWFADGWASPVVRCMVPIPHERKIRVMGSVPANIGSQQITVVAGKRELAAFSLSTGDFDLQIQVPPDLRGMPLAFHLHAMRWVNDASVESPFYRRKLCYVLRQVGLTTT